MTCSGEQKVTRVILKVDLDCYQCYRKIKTSLCRFPQIRDQVYDEKQNSVCITIYCCSPERILDKLCSKAGKSIKSIHIVPPKKPDSDAPKPSSDPEKPKAKPPAPAPAPEPEKPKPAAAAAAPQPPAPAPAPEEKPAPMKKSGSKNGSKNGSAPAPAPKAAEEAPTKAAEEAPKGPAPKPNEPAQAAEPVAQWVQGYPPGPPPQVYPVSVFCDGGYPPYHHAAAPHGFYQYGRPQCPPGYYAQQRCDYFSEENPSACSIM